jgi:hypothetical protein
VARQVDLSSVSIINIEERELYIMSFWSDVLSGGIFMHLQSRAKTLQNVLECAADGGVILYRGNHLATPGEIAKVQQVNEKQRYIPEFVVKDKDGNLKEIWYGRFLKQ